MRDCVCKFKILSMLILSSIRGAAKNGPTYFAAHGTGHSRATHSYIQHLLSPNANNAPKYLGHFVPRVAIVLNVTGQVTLRTSSR